MSDCNHTTNESCLRADECAECLRKAASSFVAPADSLDPVLRLRALLGVIEAHECTCFSCDRDGETYCDCIEKEAKLAKAMLTQNDRTEP